MDSTHNARTSLQRKAFALPVAKSSDFHGDNRPPSGIDADQLRIITDTALRSRLIIAGLAEGLQSPKGPQKIPSIIRIYPNFDAPRREAGPKRRGRPPRASVTGDAPRAASGLPSVEDLNALLSRIHATEIIVSRELQGKVNADIDRLKREIGHLEGDSFERTFRELQNAIESRRMLSSEIREEAFRRIEADGAFEPRRYLRLISRERSG
jgi:hypothetical protein